MATLYHVSSTDEEPNHSFCPDGPNKWCKYNLDPSTYKHRHGLPQAVVDVIEPVMGFRGFARVRANPFLECRDNQRTRSCFLL